MPVTRRDNKNSQGTRLRTENEKTLRGKGRGRVRLRVVLWGRKEREGADVRYLFTAYIENEHPVPELMIDSIIYDNLWINRVSHHALLRSPPDVDGLVDAVWHALR